MKLAEDYSEKSLQNAIRKVTPDFYFIMGKIRDAVDKGAFEYLHIGEINIADYNVLTMIHGFNIDIKFRTRWYHGEPTLVEYNYISWDHVTIKEDLVK